MTVKDLLLVCGNDLKVKVRVIKDRKVKYNIIENRADIARQSLSLNILDRSVSNVYVEHKNIFEASAFANTKPILIINIEG